MSLKYSTLFPLFNFFDQVGVIIDESLQRATSFPHFYRVITMSVAHEIFTPNPNPPSTADLDAALAPLTTIKAILSDIDGTIVHYDNKLMPAQGYELIKTVEGGKDDPQYGVRDAGYFLHKPSGKEVKCWKVPSLTLGGGYISVRTLELIDQLRLEHGIHFVLMTGARTSTMLMRRYSGTLPTTIFDVCEGGGKIWRRDTNRPYSHEVPVDTEWSSQFEAACGPWDQLDTDASTRVGVLWNIYRALSAEGYHLDAKSFSTSFLVDLAKSRACLPVQSGGEGKAIDIVEANLKERFAKGEFDDGDCHFWYVTNLGKGQVCAKGSGKHAATQYILTSLGVEASTAVALFDDENDLEFAAMCGAGFIPSVAHGSVVPAVNALNETKGHNAWLRTPVDGPLGTEAALEAILRKTQQNPYNTSNL